MDVHHDRESTGADTSAPCQGLFEKVRPKREVVARRCVSRQWLMQTLVHHSSFDRRKQGGQGDWFGRGLHICDRRLFFRLWDAYMRRHTRLPRMTDRRGASLAPLASSKLERHPPCRSRFERQPSCSHPSIRGVKTMHLLRGSVGTTLRGCRFAQDRHGGLSLR